MGGRINKISSKVFGSKTGGHLDMAMDPLDLFGAGAAGKQVEYAEEREEISKRNSAAVKADSKSRGSGVVIKRPKGK